MYRVGLIFAILADDQALDSVAQVQDVEVDQEAYADSA
jgi:hypothetical protein